MTSFGGRLSATQHACAAELRRHGVEVATANNIDQALAALIGWGIIPAPPIAPWRRP